MDDINIMIVEDEVITAMELQARLEDWGYRVTATALTGMKALEKAEETKPDLVLMDIVLKGDMDGIETADHIRLHYGIPVVYLTAYADKNTLERAKITAPYGYILKPFDSRELRIIIEIALYKNGAEKLLRQYHEHLEELVQERTKELTLANEHLRQEIFSRMQTEKELQEAKDVAEVANHAKNVFMANMNHEFRTPLTTILGYTFLLGEDKDLNELHRSYIKMINNSGNRLLQLVDNILDLVNMETGSIDLHQSTLRFPEFLDAINASTQEQAEKKGLSFLYKTSGADLPTVILADEQRLRQVLLSLLDNAVRYTEQGYVTFTVDVRGGAYQPDKAKVVAAHVRFQVQDTGIGITENQLQEIFTPFKQVAEYEHKIDGTAGLGLSGSRILTHLMDSELHVKSKEGEGSIFYFDLELTEVA